MVRYIFSFFIVGVNLSSVEPPRLCLSLRPAGTSKRAILLFRVLGLKFCTTIFTNHFIKSHTSAINEIKIITLPNAKPTTNVPIISPIIMSIIVRAGTPTQCTLKRIEILTLNICSTYKPSVVFTIPMNT